MFKEIHEYPFDSMPPVPRLPGMISEAECRYLFWTTAFRSRGSGHVVEVGSWLGRSTVHLAAGMQARGGGGKLHCFDDFRWRWGQTRKAAASGHWKRHRRLFPYQDFSRHFEANVAPYRNIVIAHKTPIEHIRWDGDPVEVLFLDAPKQIWSLEATLRAFGPSLIAGHGTLVIQDYMYFPAYPIALVCHVLSDHFEPLHWVPDASTASFRVTKPLPPDLDLTRRCDFRAWGRARLEATWNDIFRLLPEGARKRFALAPLLSLYDAGEIDLALERFRALRLDTTQRHKLRSVTTLLGIYYPELLDAIQHTGPLQRLAWRARRLYARARTASG